MSLDELVHINCFYYSFYIKKSELEKYNLNSDKLSEETKKIVKKFKKVRTIDNIHILENSALQPIYDKINNSSNILNLCKILEELNNCNFKIIYFILKLRNIYNYKNKLNKDLNGDYKYKHI